MIGPDGCGFDMRSPSEMEADDARREADEAAHAPRMAVTSRIRRVAQPPDGYLPLSLFDEVRLADPVPLYAFEDVPADVTGLAVDYLSRVARGVPARDAFRVPLAGARLVGRSADAERLLAMVDGFSDRSVRAACLLCGFDAASRRGPARWRAGRVIDPGPATVYNVRRMVARTLRFMDRVGPVVWEGFTFDGGYTDRVTSGDGDLAHRRRPVGSEGEPLAAEPDVHAAAARLLAGSACIPRIPSISGCGVWACTTRGRTRCGAFPWPGSAPMPCVRWSGM